jgi:predicted Ser/Thr protein kinase
MLHSDLDHHHAYLEILLSSGETKIRISLAHNIVATLYKNTYKPTWANVLTVEKVLDNNQWAELKHIMSMFHTNKTDSSQNRQHGKRSKFQCKLT